MASRRRILVPILFALGTTVVACGDSEEPGDLTAGSSTTVAESTTTTMAATSTTASEPSTTTTGPTAEGFDGSTTPTSIAAPPDVAMALLEDVTVSGEGTIDRIVFSFADGQVPGIDVGYLDPPVRQDGSGDVVEVAGAAYLGVRFEPASGVDLLGTLEPTYTGPARVDGSTSTVTEVVRTGDFEANLSWVIGADAEVPFRVTTDASAGQVVVELDAG